MTKYFYKETGMYIDWKQLENLPDIDSFIDVGVGAEGTPDLYEKFSEKKLVLIDPLDEAEKFYKENMQDIDAIFFKTALGDSAGSLEINVEENIGRSTILDVSEINFEGNPIEKRKIPVNTLDEILEDHQLGKIGIKIDTEGYELNVILGSKKILTDISFQVTQDEPCCIIGMGSSGKSVLLKSILGLINLIFHIVKLMVLFIKCLVIINL